ncbi:class I SAM-dependent methyltransferase [Alsobacter sp. R-9]
MSRLDSVIRRLEAQRRALDWAAERVRERPGLVVELGLGNGRTYDHLREALPGREIVVFERAPAAHPDCMPPAHLLEVGDLRDTLPAFAGRRPGEAVLVHADLGTGDAAVNAELARILSRLLPPLLAPASLVLSDQELTLGVPDEATVLGLPERRYFVYRMR